MWDENAYRKLLDGPEHAAALGLVLDGASGGLEARRVNVARHWDQDLHEGRDRLSLELRLGLERAHTDKWVRARNHVVHAGVTGEPNA